MESKVDLKIDVTVEPGTVVYKYNENNRCIDALIVIETHIVKVPWTDEYGNRKFNSCLDKQSALKPSYVETVMVVNDDIYATNTTKDAQCYPLKDVWLTPEEAMEAYSNYQIAQFNKYNKNNYETYGIFHS